MVITPIRMSVFKIQITANARDVWERGTEMDS